MPVENGMYYWRSVFKLSPTERQFLADNNINRLYLKMFDVVANNGELRPETTLLFADTLPPAMAVTPVVFIDSRALGAAVPPRLGQMIVARVDSMMVKNGYSKTESIQIDFDWTASTRAAYFEILDSIASLLHSQGRRLSTTIRLHQLAQSPPPADEGTLMVYNIGVFSNPDESNSILSTAALRPYLKYLDSYELPLSAALPIYSWDLLFRDNRFMVIARGVDHKDTAMFAPAGGNRYIARQYMPLPSASPGVEQGARLLPGDIMRHEKVSIGLLDSVTKMLSRARPDILNNIILYHLDENSINNLTDHDYETIFSRH